MNPLPESDRIRIMVVDDHALVRDGICSLLSIQPDMAVVGQAENGRLAVTRAALLRPDVILMDLEMPEMDGIEATRQITAADNPPRILVLTSFSSDDRLFPALKAGALGYLLKDSDAQVLVEAIHQVARDESWFHPRIARKLLQEVVERRERPARPARPEPGAPDTLTERELEVLRLIAQGRSNKEIADLLVIGEGTVRTHVSNIMDKFHVANRTQAVIYALKEGLTSLDDTP